MGAYSLKCKQHVFWTQRDKEGYWEECRFCGERKGYISLKELERLHPSSPTEKDKLP